MTITISNLYVSNNVPDGTTIGVLTAIDSSGNVIPCNYVLTKGSIGYFAIAGDNLATAWSVPATPGHYSVRIRAIGSSSIFRGSATFTVEVGIAAPPPPPPPPPPAPPPPAPPPPATSIMVNGANNAMVAEGAALMVNVANGPGNTTDWVGLAAAGTPDRALIAWAYLNGAQTPPAAGVTSATVMMTAPTSDGPYEARFYPNNLWTVTARSSFTVVGVAPPPPPPPPPATSIMVNGANNTMVAEGAALIVNVANGPGNTTDWVGLAAAGTPDRALIAWAYLNGAQTPPAAGVTSATVMMTAPTSDGPYEARFYPNNLWTVTARSSFTVVGVTPAPPPPPPAAVITITPNTPQVPDTTSVGAVVATYMVTMSDGSPFVGTIGFGSPNFDAGGIFALTGSPTSGNVIVNPNGPGVGPNLSTITDLITLIATQP